MSIPRAPLGLRARSTSGGIGQDLLLRATFLPGDPGIEAWQLWQSAVDLDDHLDLGSFRLLPELARRLRQRGIDDPLLDRFAGISRKHWLANRLFFQDLGALVKVLGARDVRVMVPAEVALALQYYPDHPLDAAVNRAIVVCADRAVTAVEVLEAAGWTAIPRIASSLLDDYVSARSWHPFRGPAGSRLRLHWHVLAQRATPAVDREYWSRATEVSIGDETVVTLSATDQVVQLCARRVGRRPAPLFQRAVDVMMLLSACLGQIDWERLVAESAKPGLILPIRETLGYLQNQLDKPVPAPVFTEIKRHPVSGLERLEFELTGRRAPGMGDVLGLWLDYRRASTASLLASAVHFPRFLQCYLKLAHLWQVPVRALAVATDRIREPIGEAVTAPRQGSDAPTPRK